MARHIDLNEIDKEMAKRTLKQYCSQWNELRYDEIRNKPYFVGKKLQDSPTEVMLPINCSKTLTIEELKSCVKNSTSTSVNFAIYGSDSAVVLYKAQMGLKPPVPINEKENCCMSDNSDICEQSSRPSKKRKVDSTNNSNMTDLPAQPINPEQEETSSTTDCLQIDLHPSVESELSATDPNSSEESNDAMKG